MSYFFCTVNFFESQFFYSFRHPQKEMLKIGICVPVRDAAWETSNAFEDLYQRPHCAAETCLNVLQTEDDHKSGNQANLDTNASCFFSFDCVPVYNTVESRNLLCEHISVFRKEST